MSMSKISHEPHPERGRPQSFIHDPKPLMSQDSPNGQFPGDLCSAFLKGEHGAAWDITLQDLGRCYNMYWSWWSRQCGRNYLALRDQEHHWRSKQLPDDRDARIKELENAPMEWFWPTICPFATGIPQKHVPSKERLRELGLVVSDRLYESWTNQYNDIVRLLGGAQFSRAAKEFDEKVRDLVANRLLTDGNSELTVASAVASLPPTTINVDVGRCVRELTANAENEDADFHYKHQVDRMGFHRIYSNHKNRMRTNEILAHFNKTGMRYYKIDQSTPRVFRQCVLSNEYHLYGVEMLQLNCPTANADEGQIPHCVSVCNFGSFLATKVSQQLNHWKSAACCPVCAHKLPLSELLNDAFSLVESAGGHEADYANALMFDFERLHVEAESAWDVEFQHVQAELTPAQQRVRRALNYVPNDSTAGSAGASDTATVGSASENASNASEGVVAQSARPSHANQPTVRDYRF